MMMGIARAHASFHPRPGSPQPVGLALALESLATDTRYRTHRTPDDLARALAQVVELELRLGEARGSTGVVADAFGLAYAKVGEVDKAIAWCRATVQSSDGSASFKVAEQLGNELARNAEQQKAPTLARIVIGDAIQLLNGVVGLRPSLESSGVLGSAYKRLAQVEDRAGNKKRSCVRLGPWRLTVRTPKEWRARRVPTTCFVRQRMVSVPNCRTR